LCWQERQKVAHDSDVILVVVGVGVLSVVELRDCLKVCCSSEAETCSVFNPKQGLTMLLLAA
jgi:hypothetical protein